MAYQFKLPDIGEGLAEGEVVKWHVEVGQTLKENDPLVSILTDKAEVEIPCPRAGKVLRLMAKPGDKVPVGSVLAELDAEGAAPEQKKAEKPSAPAAAPKKGADVLASPAVRKLAGELQVDLAGVSGTGPGGRILEADLRKPLTPAQDERIPFVGIRRRTAEKMTLAAKTVPSVAHLDEADVTALVALREELKPEAAKKGVKLTYLPFIFKAVSKALAQFPNLNSELDEKGGVIVRKRAHHIGFAAQAEQGLFVPVVRDVQTKSVWAIAAETQALAEKVRAGKAAPGDLQGGTFSVTNIGPLGGLAATPIIVPPEVAILAVMKVQKRPVVKDGGIHVRDMLNLVLCFDHRVVDGAEGASFMNTLILHLENPRTLLE